MQLVIDGIQARDPKARVVAIEACTEAICERAGVDLADGVMMLLTAAAHLTFQSSALAPDATLRALAATLGNATVAAQEFFPGKVAANGR